MEKLRGECMKLKQNGAAYKLQDAEMGFTAVTGQTWRYETVKMRTGQKWKCERQYQTAGKNSLDWTNLDK
jgi:hypothetical protein